MNTHTWQENNTQYLDYLEKLDNLSQHPTTAILPYVLALTNTHGLFYQLYQKKASGALIAPISAALAYGLYHLVDLKFNHSTFPALAENETVAQYTALSLLLFGCLQIVSALRVPLIYTYNYFLGCIFPEMEPDKEDRKKPILSSFILRGISFFAAWIFVNDSAEAANLIWPFSIWQAADHAPAAAIILSMSSAVLINYYLNRFFTQKAFDSFKMIKESWRTTPKGKFLASIVATLPAAIPYFIVSICNLSNTGATIKTGKDLYFSIVIGALTLINYSAQSFDGASTIVNSIASLHCRKIPGRKEHQQAIQQVADRVTFIKREGITNTGIYRNLHTLPQSTDDEIVKKIIIQKILNIPTTDAPNSSPQYKLSTGTYAVYKMAQWSINSLCLLANIAGIIGYMNSTASELTHLVGIPLSHPYIASNALPLVGFFLLAASQWCLLSFMVCFDTSNGFAKSLFTGRSAAYRALSSLGKTQTNASLFYGFLFAFFSTATSISLNNILFNDRLNLPEFSNPASAPGALLNIGMVISTMLFNGYGWKDEVDSTTRKRALSTQENQKVLTCNPVTLEQNLETCVSWFTHLPQKKVNELFHFDKQEKLTGDQAPLTGPYALP